MENVADEAFESFNSGCRFPATVFGEADGARVRRDRPNAADKKLNAVRKSVSTQGRSSRRGGPKRGNYR